MQRYIRNGRDLGGWSHCDVSYQGTWVAALILLGHVARYGPDVLAGDHSYRHSHPDRRRHHRNFVPRRLGCRERPRASPAPPRARPPPDPNLGSRRSFAEFAAQAHHQSVAVADSAHADDDEAFIDAISLDEEWGAARSRPPRPAAATSASRDPSSSMQDDRSDATDSITICAMTTDPTNAPLFRLAVVPDASNQLREVSRLMVDKLTTVPRSKLGERVGRLNHEDMIRLGRAIIVFLGPRRTV